MSSETGKSSLGWLEALPWGLLIIGSLTLGLAPFFPQPHLVEKVGMLFQGELVRPIDIFDLCLHGAFPALLLLKGVMRLRDNKGRTSATGRNAED